MSLQGGMPSSRPWTFGLCSGRRRSNDIGKARRGAGGGWWTRSAWCPLSGRSVGNQALAGVRQAVEGERRVGSAMLATAVRMTDARPEKIMKIEETTLPDVKVLTPRRFGDQRGFFTESYQ